MKMEDEIAQLIKVTQSLKPMLEKEVNRPADLRRLDLPFMATEIVWSVLFPAFWHKHSQEMLYQVRAQGPKWTAFASTYNQPIIDYMTKRNLN